MRKVIVQNLQIGKGCPLTVVSGPCVIENEDHALYCAAFLKEAFAKTGIQFIYKSSYDKANRSSGKAFRGPGLEEGLKILERVQKEFDVPVFTDVHSPEEAIAAGEVCDVIQIPAFLCRQTDLLLAAGKTGATVNIKKGQFMAPWDMKNAVDKVLSTGNKNVLLTDRGTCFGYNNLVSDMRAVPIMQELGVPVLFDATHSVQLPGGHGDKTGGERKFVEVLARAALGAGCNGIFAEAHPDPTCAPSDADCQIPFSDLARLLAQWERIYDAVAECVHA